MKETELSIDHGENEHGVERSGFIDWEGGTRLTSVEQSMNQIRITESNRIRILCISTVPVQMDSDCIGY